MLTRLTSFRNLFIFGVATYFIAMPIAQRLVPSSYWLEVHRMEISGTWVGEDPNVYVDRTLHLTKPTRGIWTAKVATRDGEVVCANSNTALYEPGSKLPGRSRLKLFKWWLNAGAEGPASVCTTWPLPAGWYCVSTQRELFPENYPTSKIVDSPTACFLFVDRPPYARATREDQTSLWRPPQPPA